MNKKVVIISVCLLLSIGGFVGYKHFFLDKSKKETENASINDTGVIINDEPVSIEPIDAEAYLNEIGEVQSKIDVHSSETVMTGAETFGFLIERGFGECLVYTNYSMDGIYQEEQEITSNSLEQRPIYITYYLSDDESIWKLSLVNGTLLAEPIFYNYREGADVPVILSETNTMTSYDNVTNQFFVVTPDSSKLVLKSVSEINATLLDSLNIEEIDAL